MTRLPLWVSLACLPITTVSLLAADTSLQTTLKAIEHRYNSAKTLQVHFVESYSVLGRARQSESGELTLRKPGRMRWDYAQPSGKLFVSDGKDVYLYTPDAHRVEKAKLKASEDLRAPLAFLLGKLDFNKEFKNFQTKPEGANQLITAEAKNENSPYGHVQMLITPNDGIERLVVNGTDSSILTFQFADEKLNPRVDDAMFKFKMPPGATLVDAEGTD